MNLDHRLILWYTCCITAHRGVGKSCLRVCQLLARGVTKRSRPTPSRNVCNSHLASSSSRLRSLQLSHHQRRSSERSRFQNSSVSHARSTSQKSSVPHRAGSPACHRVEIRTSTLLLRVETDSSNHLLQDRNQACPRKEINEDSRQWTRRVSLPHRPISHCPKALSVYQYRNPRTMVLEESALRCR